MLISRFLKCWGKQPICNACLWAHLLDTANSGTHTQVGVHQFSPWKLVDQQRPLGPKGRSCHRYRKFWDFVITRLTSKIFSQKSDFWKKVYFFTKFWPMKCFKLDIQVQGKRFKCLFKKGTFLIDIKHCLILVFLVFLAERLQRLLQIIRKPPRNICSQNRIPFYKQSSELI